LFLKLLGIQDLRAIRSLPKGQRASGEKKRANLVERLEKEGLSPTLLDIAFSEDDILLDNIQHVRHGCFDEADGLEETIPVDDKYVWPFSSCNSSGWVFDEQFHVYRYCDEYSDLCALQETEIHKFYVQARMRMERGDIDEAVAWYSRIVQVAPENDKDFLLQSTAFTSLGELLSSNSRVASQHRFMKNDCKAALLFKVGAVVFKNPHAMYCYGLALNNGQGGVKKCRSKSIHLLNAAGAQHIGEAYYALGSIYEATATSNAENTRLELISLASRFYSSASQAYTFKYSETGRNNDGTCTRVTHVPPPGACCTPSIASIASLPLTEGWQPTHLRDTLAVRLFWSLAGQAFLFSAASSLVSSTFIGSAYQALVVIIPTLGVILSLHGLMQATEAIVRARQPWNRIRKMTNEKINAYGCTLKLP
jgi:tetratricopeptide (TPR) repeat protein